MLKVENKLDVNTTIAQNKHISLCQNSLFNQVKKIKEQRWICVFFKDKKFNMLNIFL